MLDEVTIRALVKEPERLPTDVVADLDSIQTAILSAKSLPAELQLETRRRVAERKFNILSERALPFTYIEAILKEIRHLGYTNLDIEGKIEVIFARYCIREGYADQARAVVVRLLGRIPDSPPEEEIAVAQQLRNLCGKILSELK
jgi:hypothetical protein